MNDPLVELVERVQKATGPDREIDARLWCLNEGVDFVLLGTGKERYADYIGDDDSVQNRSTRVDRGCLVFSHRTFDPARENQVQMFHNFTAYTDSIDDAKTFLHARIPAAMWCVGSMEEGPFCRIVVPDDSGGYGGGYRTANAANEPLALILATLRALSSQEASK